MISDGGSEVCGTTVSHDPERPSARIKTLRVIAALCILGAGISVLIFAITENIAANRDFITYWAAAHEFAHHRNPYDSQAILRLEQSVGFHGNQPFLMRNPPSVFFLALPLGFVGAKTGAVLWSLALCAALGWSVRILWILHGRPPDRLHLVGYVFPPAMACLFAGQTGIFILFGVTLFLYCYASHPYLAGVALLLCAIKPHLFLPFGVVLLAWMVVNKSYRILIGACAAQFASLGLSYFLDPSGWSHYAQMMNGAKLQEEFIPTLSLMFRLIIHRDAVWLQFVPACVGSVWALQYFWKRRKEWKWMDQGLLLLIISVMVAPYAWFTDEVVLLPAILAGLYRASDRGRSLLPFLCIAGAALIEVFLNSSSSALSSGLFLWTAPAWLAWYLSTMRGRQGLALESGA